MPSGYGTPLTILRLRNSSRSREISWKFTLVQNERQGFGRESKKRSRNFLSEVPSGVNMAK
jgi:hypothetical protein